MASFYGGMPTVSFSIKQTYESLEDAKEMLEKGESSTKDVGYGEYFVISTPDLANRYNGTMWRRDITPESQIGVVDYSQTTNNLIEHYKTVLFNDGGVFIGRLNGATYLPVYDQAKNELFWKDSITGKVLNLEDSKIYFSKVDQDTVNEYVKEYLGKNKEVLIDDSMLADHTLASTKTWSAYKTEERIRQIFNEEIDKVLNTSYQG